jgi:hypothetical protein
MEMYCPVHHSFIHREDIRIVGEPGGEVRFFRPDGSEISAGCGPLERQVREWFDATVFGPLVPVMEEAGRAMAEVAGRPP